MHSHILLDGTIIRWETFDPDHIRVQIAPYAPSPDGQRRANACAWKLLIAGTMPFIHGSHRLRVDGLDKTGGLMVSVYLDGEWFGRWPAAQLAALDVRFAEDHGTAEATHIMHWLRNVAAVLRSW